MSTTTEQNSLVERKNIQNYHTTYLSNFHQLFDNVLPPEARKPLVPDRGEKLLDARVSHECLLFVINRELEPL